MATLAHASDGQILVWVSPATPPNSLYYDPHTNPSLYSEVYSDPTAYRVTNGALTRDGEPVAINPPCDDCQTLDSLDSATTIAQLRKVLILLRDKPGFTRG